MNTKMFVITLVALLHLFVTFPSFIFHGIRNMYYRSVFNNLTVVPLKNEDVVIFVHGRGGHFTDFTHLIRNLSGLTDKFLRVVDLGNTHETSVDEDTYKLKERLEKYQGCNITLVGLSKGGLVIMRYITIFNDIRIKKAITISAPLMGTKVTPFAFSDITHKELGYGSELTREIASCKKRVPIYHVVPTWDHMIIPSTSAAYIDTDPKNIYIYKGYNSHSGILNSSDVALAIAVWL